jgi:S-layer homology domain
MKSKKALGFMVAAALLASPAALPASAAYTDFTDIQNSFAKDAILQLGELGIITGLPSGQFNPAGKISRQDFAIILAKALKLDVTSPSSSPSFSDVPADHYSYKYVEAAVKAGLINGTGAGKFGGREMLSRQDMATLFVRALGVDASDYGNKLTFADAADISGYARDSVAYAVEAGLLNGVGHNSFNPRGMADRQAVALVASKFLKVKEELIKPEPAPAPKPEPTPIPVPRVEPIREPANHKPKIENEVVEQTAYVNGSISIAISGIFSDADDDILEITAESLDREIAEASVDGDLLFIHGQKAGSTSIALTANDGNGGITVHNFNVEVIHPVSNVAINTLRGMGADSSPVSVIPENLAAQPDESGKIKITFEQDREVGGIGYYDFAMSHATVEFNTKMDISSEFPVFMQVGELNPVEYGKLKYFEGKWTLMPCISPQTFQTPGLFTLSAALTDIDGKPFRLEVLLEVTEAPEQIETEDISEEYLELVPVDNNIEETI